MRPSALFIRATGISAVMLGVLLMHGLTTTPSHTVHDPGHAMNAPHALAIASPITAVLPIDVGSVSDTLGLGAGHAAVLCLWILTGGIAAAATGRVLRRVTCSSGVRLAFATAHRLPTWPGPAPPTSWSYLALGSLRR